MSTNFNKTVSGNETSFYIGVFQDNLEQTSWHYHNSYEIHFILEGSGKRIVGDSMEEFHPGDLVFIGKNLPHVWIADREHVDVSRRMLESVFLQFTPEILIGEQLELPEFKYVTRALSLSERGMQIKGDTLNVISELLLQMPYMNAFDRMIFFYTILDRIGRCENFKPLVGKEYMKTRFTPQNKRIATIHDYMMNNYKDDINLHVLAEKVSMAEGSLCRFFKSNTGMTLFEYLNKIKINFACKLLMNRELSILDVCLDSGYNNISHFNKQFRRFIGCSPDKFRKRYKFIA
ncbi:MAG: AraC family transcriptional regulator [Tannerella sp.]|jgi:AraC-like DNA-binding protein|nr:AraC family transcriptional regulator [Tannerella sp.]